MRQDDFPEYIPHEEMCKLTRGKSVKFKRGQYYTTERGGYVCANARGNGKPELRVCWSLDEVYGWFRARRNGK